METMTHKEIAEQLKETFGADWDKFSFDERVSAIAYAIQNKTTDKEKVRPFEHYSYSLYHDCHTIEQVADEFLEGLGVFDFAFVRDYFDIESFEADWSNARNCVEVEYEDDDDYFNGFVVWS